VCTVQVCIYICSGWVGGMFICTVQVCIPFCDGSSMYILFWVGGVCAQFKMVIVVCFKYVYLVLGGCVCTVQDGDRCDGSTEEHHR